MKDMEENITGRVLEIQRMSTEDGPGIRTTVFLKGCTLNCTWCHNPESINPGFEVQWIQTSCIGCRTCIDTCEASALSLSQGEISIDRDLCTSCLSCTEECPSMAMEVIGSSWTVEDLIHELVKDRAFFEESGGGITISGGELTMQTDFSTELLKGLQEKKIKTAIDTCGQCAREALEKLLPHADLVLFDLKEMDPKLHKDFTGKTNTRILDNLKFVAEWIRDKKADNLWIRTPVIPGATMGENNIRAMGEFISKNLNGCVARWELCTFNNLCRDKYARLGRKWKHEGDKLISLVEIENLYNIARQSGVDYKIVHWSGSTE